LALASLSAPAQTVAEQLQKGIFAQQTSGDLDAAIQIFRQIIASNPVDRSYAAQAQLHLAQALLQKGDLNGAATEYNILAANYSDFHDLVASMSRTMNAVNHERVFTRGTVTISKGEPDKFEHTVTHVALTAPPKWQLEGSSESSDGGDIVMFSTSEIRTDILAAWMRAYTGHETDFTAMLRHDAEHKAQDRKDYTGWAIRPESVQLRTIAGHQALSAVADYTEPAIQGQMVVWRNGQTTVVNPHASSTETYKMAEYFIWVRSPKTFVQFFGRAKADDLPKLQAGLDQLAATAVIP